MEGNNYYYKILGVKPDASKQEIEEGFHRAIKAYHPDNGTSNEEMIKDVLTAYQTLSDEESRANYDQKQGIGQSYGTEAVHFSSVENVRANHGNSHQAFNGQSKQQVLRDLTKGEEVAKKLRDLLAEFGHIRPEIHEKKGVWSILLLSPVAWVVAFMIVGTSMMDMPSNNSEAITVICIAAFFVIIWPLVTIVMAAKNAKWNNAAKKKDVASQEAVMKRKETLATTAKQLSIQSQEILNILPPRYQYYEAYKGIRELIEDGRVDTMKEALNLYATTKYQEDMLEGLSTISQQLAGLSESINNMKVDVHVTNY